MKNVLKVVSTLALAAVLGSIFTPAQADETLVQTPNANVYTGSAGTSVVAPGVTINLPNAATSVSTIQSPTTSSVTTTVQTTVSPSTQSYANAQLAGMNFSNQNLAGVDFTNAVLSEADFSGANLKGAIFTNATLNNVNFTNAQLTGADLTNATLSGANLTNADFSKANLTNAKLDQALAVKTRFTGAMLTNVDMSKLIRKAATRPVLVDAKTISSNLRIDPAHPTVPRKMDLTINFDFNSDKLTTAGTKQVAQIAAALKDQPLAQAHIVVEGHTDYIGTDAYNQDLSLRRATQVLQTLTAQYGIDPSHLSAQGYGKTRPIASNDNDLGRAMNRRVTLINMASN